MMKELNAVRFEEGKFNCRVYFRGGSKSPHLVLINYKNRWVTPYEQNLKRSPTWTCDGLLRVLYSSVYIPELVYTRNPFLDLSPKDQ